MLKGPDAAIGRPTSMNTDDMQLDGEATACRVSSSASGDVGVGGAGETGFCPSVYGRNCMASLSTPRKVGLVLGPLLFLIFSFIEISDEHPLANDALAGTAWIAVWWITEVIPVPATALMPLLLYPLCSIGTGGTFAAKYYNGTTFLFLGAFLAVAALEKVNGHRRFALWMMQFFGTTPHFVMLGFMITAAVLSMFSSNTSTAILMMPMVSGFLTGRTETEGGKRFEKAALLGVAYASSSGGICTIIGTPPNAIFALNFERAFPKGPSVDFSSWFVFAFPIGLLMVLLCWAVLSLMYLRNIKVDLNREAMRAELAALGRVTRDEKAVFVVFMFMVIMWMVRPYTIQEVLGYCSDKTLTTQTSCEANIANTWKGYADDGTVAVFGAVLFFLIPSASRPGEMILDESAFKHIAWGILLLFGAGYAIGEAFSSSGLSVEIGDALSTMTDMSPFGLVFIITTVICFLTELISNTATVSLFLPIMQAAAVQNGINPMLLMLPTTISTSLAYLLPTATPPNAVVFATGKITFMDMIKPGIFINVFGILITTCFIFITGSTFTDLNSFPDWAQPAR